MTLSTRHTTEMMPSLASKSTRTTTTTTTTTDRSMLHRLPDPVNTSKSSALAPVSMPRQLTPMHRFADGSTRFGYGSQRGQQPD
ncbi:hypothetical protein Vi05172_g7761 [Venturia inaequalis]|nr:hypothetical protein Vi05172_g7761 [Venturia inaequalis]